MAEAISNTSPLLYLYRIGRVEWLAKLFGTVYIPNTVAAELRQGRERGFDTPDPGSYRWVQLQDPRLTPSEWLALDLGPGELAGDGPRTRKSKPRSTARRQLGEEGSPSLRKTSMMLRFAADENFVRYLPL